MSSLKQTIGNEARPRKPGLHTGDMVWRVRQTREELSTIQGTPAQRSAEPSSKCTAGGRFLRTGDISKDKVYSLLLSTTSPNREEGKESHVPVQESACTEAQRCDCGWRFEDRSSLLVQTGNVCWGGWRCSCPFLQAVNMCSFCLTLLTSLELGGRDWGRHVWEYWQRDGYISYLLM